MQVFLHLLIVAAFWFSSSMNPVYSMPDLTAEEVEAAGTETGAETEAETAEETFTTSDQPSVNADEACSGMTEFYFPEDKCRQIVNDAGGTLTRDEYFSMRQVLQACAPVGPAGAQDGSRTPQRCQDYAGFGFREYSFDEQGSLEQTGNHYQIEPSTSLGLQADGSPIAYSGGEAGPFFSSNSPTMTQMNLLASSYGTSQLRESMVRMNLCMRRNDKMSRSDCPQESFPSDPFFKEHLKDSSEMTDLYTGVKGRSIDAQLLLGEPYNGNIRSYLADQFYMSDEHTLVAMIMMNATKMAASGEKSTEDLLTIDTVDAQGNLNPEIIEQLQDAGTFYINGDGPNEIAKEQAQKWIQMGKCDPSAEDPCKVLREEMELMKEKIEEDEELKKEVRMQKDLKLLESTADGSYGARVLDTMGERRVCYRLGLNGYPTPPKENNNCKVAWENGKAKFIEQVQNSSDFNREDYVDPTTGRIDEDVMVQAMYDKRQEELENKYADEPALQSVIDGKARLAVIQDVAQLDIRNNPATFNKSGGVISKSGGGFSPLSESQKQQAIADATEEHGESENANSEMFAQSGVDVNNPTESEVEEEATVSGSGEVQSHNVAMIAAAYNEDLAADVDSDVFVPQKTEGESGGGFSLFGSSDEGAKEPNPEDNPLYGVGRESILEWPEELRTSYSDYTSSGNEMQTVVGFCTPSLIYPPGQDPNCRCVKGENVRSQVQADDAFVPCRGDDDFDYYSGMY